MAPAFVFLPTEVSCALLRPANILCGVWPCHIRSFPRAGILDPTHSHRADLLQTTGDPLTPSWSWPQALGQGVVADTSLGGYQQGPGPS